MCGIIGAFNFNKNKETVNENVLNILQDQIQRGKEGFGVTMIGKNNKVETMRATIPAKAILDLYMNKAKMIVMHHRMPTSSENKISQTHPIEVDNNLLKYKYLVVHNGVVRNCDKLKKEHEAKGYKYTTVRIRQWYSKEEEEYNDSEALAIEAACYIEKQTKGLKIEGSVAFIAIQIEKETNIAKQIFFGRNDSNPLKLSASRNKIRLSSEGEGDNIKESILYNFKLKDFKIHKRKLEFIEAPKEFLPDVKTSFHSNNSVIDTREDPFAADGFTHYNSDIEEDADDKLAEAIDDNVTMVDELIASYFSVLSREELLLKEDIDMLYRDTAKQVLIMLREAKGKAFDTLGDHLYENTQDRTEAEEAKAVKLEEESAIELEGEKLHAK